MMGISSLAIQGDLVVSGSWDSTVIAWKQIKEAPYLKALKIIDLGEQIVSLDLDDNLDLAVGAISGIIKIISLKTYSLIDTFRSSTLPLCWSVSLSRTKVEATIGCNYHAWDRTSKQQVGFIGKVHSQNISCLCVDRVKRLIFTGCLDGKVRMFSRGSKPMLLRQFGGHRAGVRGMALLDNMIITGSSDKTAMITFRDRHESSKPDALYPNGIPKQEGDYSRDDEAGRVAQPVSLLHPASVNAVDADTSILITGAEDGIVRIFDFGYDLWRPPTPSSPRLCGQTSLVSSASTTCVLMATPDRQKVSVGNRRQTWGTCALAVLTRARTLKNEYALPGSQPVATWMDVDEIYQCMVDWDLLPVSQGSTPKHTLNLALHMMAKSGPPTLLIDST
ncbi:hypothetical protein BGZ98_008258, partial [Dissophora globulifera]